jgi:hypothetical protein
VWTRSLNLKPRPAESKSRRSPVQVTADATGPRLRTGVTAHPDFGPGSRRPGPGVPKMGTVTDAGRRHAAPGLGVDHT